MGLPPGVGRIYYFIPPPTLEQAAAAAWQRTQGITDAYDGLWADLHAAIDVTQQQRDAAEQRWWAKKPGVTAQRTVSAMRRELYRIWADAWDWAMDNPQPGLFKLRQDLDYGYYEPASHRNVWGVDEDPAAFCGAETSNHTRWTDRYRALVDVDDNMSVALSSAADGYARALRDPDARELVRLEAQLNIQLEQASRADDVVFHGIGPREFWVEYVDTDQDGEDDDEILYWCGGMDEVTGLGGKAELPGGSACSEGPRQFGVLFASFEKQCENISFKVKTPGWVGAFAKFTINLHDGSLTILAGGHVSTPLPIPGLKASVEAGFYVKIDRNNKVTDYGYTTPKLTGSLGNKELSMTIASAGGARVSMAGSHSGWPSAP